MLRPCQDEKTGFFSPIDQALKIGKKGGESLRLIDHRALPKVLEKSPGVGGQEFELIGVFEGDVRLIGEDSLDESGFPGLAGTRDGNNRESLSEI